MDSIQRLSKLLSSQPPGRPLGYSSPSILNPQAVPAPPAPYVVADAARDLDMDPAIIEAFAAIESVQGAFDSHGRPVVLFERHKFDAATKGVYRAIAPDLSNPSRGGYGAYVAQHDRLARARALGNGAADGAAAASTSWGRWQIMGFNYVAAGFGDLVSFEAAMRRSEGDQLRAFVAFVRHEGIDGLLRAGDYEGAVRKYNGPGQVIYYLDRFKKALASARAKSSKGKRRPG